MAITRRSLLAAPLAAPLESAPLRRETFIRAPGKGVAVIANAYYLRARGTEMESMERRISRSDTVDVIFCRRSKDNGRTWSAPVEKATRETHPDGTLRRHPHGGWVDPKTGRYIEFLVQGVLPSDNPLEGMQQWNVFWRAQGGGDSWSGFEQIVCRGAEFSPAHPMPGVYTGKTCVMLGDLSCQPIAGPGGTILLPAQVTRLGPDGNVYNPAGGYTYTDAMVLIGRWQGRKLVWEAGEPIQGDPARSTRGMVEPTLGMLADGRLIAVLRGSNDRKPDLPSYKWVSYSDDGGRRWTTPAPWTYAGGERFFSPSACSQLLRHSSGRLFWLGNISPANPAGNRPRYPFHIGEVDRRSGLLRRETVRVIDDKAPGESDRLTLSNFYAREDRETKDIVLYMTRLFDLPTGWAGDALVYWIPV